MTERGPIGWFNHRDGRLPIYATVLVPLNRITRGGELATIVYLHVGRAILVHPKRWPQLLFMLVPSHERELR